MVAESLQGAFPLEDKSRAVEGVLLRRTFRAKAAGQQKIIMEKYINLSNSAHFSTFSKQVLMKVDMKSLSTTNLKARHSTMTQTLYLFSCIWLLRAKFRSTKEKNQYCQNNTAYF